MSYGPFLFELGVFKAIVRMRDGTFCYETARNTLEAVAFGLDCRAFTCLLAMHPHLYSIRYLLYCNS